MVRSFRCIDSKRLRHELLTVIKDLECPAARLQFFGAVQAISSAGKDRPISHRHRATGGILDFVLPSTIFHQGMFDHLLQLDRVALGNTSELKPKAETGAKLGRNPGGVLSEFRTVSRALHAVKSLGIPSPLRGTNRLDYPEFDYTAARRSTSNRLSSRSAESSAKNQH